MYDIQSPSAFDSALKERLALFLPAELTIASYEEWGGHHIKTPTLLIQWEDAHPGQQSNDGRYQHGQMITAHCCIPLSHPNAVMTATDMAFAIERLLFRRQLFLEQGSILVDSEVVGMPDIQNNGDTTFLIGLPNITARGVQWLQPLYFGPSLYEPSPTRNGWSFEIIAEPGYPLGNDLSDEVL